MPAIIEHIDRIARDKRRDVLYVEFLPEVRRGFDWQNLPVRQQVIAWLDEHEINWCPCGDYASTSVSRSYRGQIYIDVPFELESPIYQRLCAFLEKPDGSSALDGARFCYLPLANALENAAHDQPGFWD